MTSKKRRYSQVLDLVVYRKPDTKRCILLDTCHDALPEELFDLVMSFRKKCRCCGRKQNQFAPGDNLCIQCVSCYRCRGRQDLLRWRCAQGVVHWTCPQDECQNRRCDFCMRPMRLPAATPLIIRSIFTRDIFCNEICEVRNEQANALAELAAEFASELAEAAVTTAPIGFNVSIFSDRAYRHYTGALFNLIENHHVD